MPIKNYRSHVSATRSIEEIQSALVKNGATGVMFEYEPFSNGRVSSLVFRLSVNDNPVSFSLPVNWRAFQAVLKKQRVPRWDDEDYVYRVAWRCLRDWALAQMALYETSMVDLPQVFFPFATAIKGRTAYELVKNNQLLLPEKR
jgi:hypothetical protein